MFVLSQPLADGTSGIDINLLFIMLDINNLGTYLALQQSEAGRSSLFTSKYINNETIQIQAH
jgi:hypothetical protein